MITQSLPTYYKKRAQEYEKIYYRNDPIRQKEQTLITTVMQKELIGKSVLEVACGTGYWTEFLSQTAKKITATDYVEEVLKIAETKQYNCPISFKKEDAYNLSFIENSFNAGMANFWISHVPHEKMQNFLIEFHRTLRKGSTLFFIDSVYVDGIGGELIHKEEDKNTYKIRELSDGSKREVLKNYYLEEEVSDLFDGFCVEKSFKIFYGKCFWYATYIRK